ncbi:MAG TPA: FKBP-type peptidyl-prolyl cis-trans isomerase [Anditalea sp.]|nr:FKBP-type peptidyl-prolyl cis-trans isomerase [Anditalea sp.]
MKRILLCCSLVILMASCINDQESQQNLHNRDLQAIADYMENNDLQGVKTEQDGNTGIVIIWTEENPDGERPALGDSLVVDYIGSFLDNRVFDTSIDSVARANNIHISSRTYEPFRIALGVTGLIDGFNFGVFNMREGEKAIVLIPSLYGYGSTGSRDGSIPPHTPLRFDLDLLEILEEVENEI